jgi:hypothetical protein
MNALGPGERLPVIIVAITLGVMVVVFVVACVCGTVYKMHKNRLDDGLKRELLDRGMSADEIVAVVRARPTKHSRGCGSPSSIRSDIS